MILPTSVRIHPSQFPDSVRRDLLASLHTRRVNHKFHYDSLKQTQKWLALHEAHSPARYDADCLATYERAFAAAVARNAEASVHVIGLGCGGGQKDGQLLKLLAAAGKQVSYTPCDVSVAMVLVARAAALAWVPPENCFPFVCDLATADDLRESLATRHPALITFFGMIPNFEPQRILPKLAALLRPEDRLLFSANLAPGPDYLAGMKKILPQYDDLQTQEWLLTFLLDLGVERTDGELRFQIEADAANDLQRVVADFHFTRPRHLEIGTEPFDFAGGEVIRLFYSYRYTPDRVRAQLAQHGVAVETQWLAGSEEEGVFLCHRK